MPDDQVEAQVTQAVARQLLLGSRESLTIAGRLRERPEVVNAALLRLRADCDGCILLTQPYAGEARFVVSIVTWEALKRCCAPPNRYPSLVSEGGEGAAQIIEGFWSNPSTFVCLLTRRGVANIPVAASAATASGSALVCHFGIVDRN